MTSTTKRREKNEAKRKTAAEEAKSRGAMLASVRVDPRRITLAKLKFMGEEPDYAAQKWNEPRDDQWQYQD